MTIPDAAQQYLLSHIAKHGPLERIFTSDKCQPWKFKTSDGMEVQSKDFHKMLITGKIRHVSHSEKIIGMPKFYEVSK